MVDLEHVHGPSRAVLRAHEAGLRIPGQVPSVEETEPAEARARSRCCSGCRCRPGPSARGSRRAWRCRAPRAWIRTRRPRPPPVAKPRPLPAPGAGPDPAAPRRGAPRRPSCRLRAPAARAPPRGPSSGRVRRGCPRGGGEPGRLRRRSGLDGSGSRSGGRSGAGRPPPSPPCGCVARHARRDCPRRSGRIPRRG